MQKYILLPHGEDLPPEVLAAIKVLQDWTRAREHRRLVAYAESQKLPVMPHPEHWGSDL